MEKKKVKVVEYNNHPEIEGDELKVVIMNNENKKTRMRTTKGPRKPKQPRMTINQLAVIVNNLAIEMRAGFAAINKEIVDIKETLKRHEEIFARNNLK
ncbi:MAG: hypothetical protein LBB45_04455 [Methanobrevibacter sp.]|jgi:hypothetical protein|nr:hypothetical protein [Candidatus Methanovirga basalitermitum]